MVFTQRLYAVLSLDECIPKCVGMRRDGGLHRCETILQYETTLQCPDIIIMLRLFHDA
jgi:hypothetical protein